MNRKDRIVVWYCVIVMILILGILYLLTGCTKSAKLDMIWVEGADCTFIGSGMSASQMTSVQKDFHFKECGVDMEAEEEHDGSTEGSQK